jgi:hypothetical protein
VAATNLSRVRGGVERDKPINEDFRAAYTNRWNSDRATRDRVLRDTSIRGVEVLRILALSIRSDQDYGLTENASVRVGALRGNATEGETKAFVREYRPPYSQLAGFASLKLRHALNKVAHANPRGSGFFADAENHDLILTGDERGSTWVAVISLIDLCNVIKSLPDANTRQ